MLPTRLKVLVPLLFFGAAYAGKHVYDKRRKKEEWLVYEKLEDSLKRIESLPSISALRSNILTPVSDKTHRMELAKRYLQLVSLDPQNNNSEYLVIIKKMRQGQIDKVQLLTKEWLNAVIGQQVIIYLTFLARERVGEYETQKLACQALSTILANSAFCRPEYPWIRQNLRQAFSLEPMLLPELCLLPSLDPHLLEEISTAICDAEEERLEYGVKDKRNVIMALGELWMTTIQRKESASNSPMGYPPMDDYGFSNPTSEWDPLTDPTMTAKSTRAMLRIMNEAILKDNTAAFRILLSGGLSTLKSLAETVTEEWWESHSKDYMNLVLTEVARLVANLVLFKEGTKIAICLQWPQTLMDWLYHDEFCKSNDMLQLEVLRAIANMQPERNWKYPNGIFLIYPTTRMRWEPQLDIVLVHGLLGGPLRTWRVGRAPSNHAIVEQEYYVSDDEDSNTASVLEQDHHEKDEKLVVWPRDWLSKDIPNIRVLSVSYDTSISAWRSYGLPLKHQAAELLEKLCDAGIGTRPCVILTHSYGGLVTKQAIVDAVHSMNEKYLRLVDSIRGLVFFSTPHLGSPIVGYLKRAIVGSTFRPSVAVNELYPGSTMLLELNEEFKRVVHSRWYEFSSNKRPINTPHLEVLSMGETLPTKLTQWSSQYITSLLVPVETANPGIGRFIPVRTADHLTVCKPSSVDDLRYQEVLKLIRRAMKDTSHVDSCREH
ncbi:hypothetical protein GpartN1_g3043.t1 [Galdieria partita]|uniref:Protein SERAC1 n=1 Tax=Galdieria partita TaxID=83374 RepID=A0A9C7PWM5_9RHOD|nr:hypothetical protein GpartN1_g3043.t1 [Galdieria partita]